MPRSAPLRALHRLTKEHTIAHRSGTPVGELRDACTAARWGELPRRDALRLGIGGGAALATGLAAAPRPARAASSGAPPRVAVIGAGLAGLNAALRLQDAGVGCALYEAADRVGGRVFSEREHWTSGQTSEWGGELIDRDHHEMHRLCRRFGLAQVDVVRAEPRGSEQVLHVGGGYYPRSRADEEFAPVHAALRADVAAVGKRLDWQHATPGGVELSQMSLDEWIETRVPGGRCSKFGRFIEVAYTVEYGADVAEQTALNLVTLMGDQHDPEHFDVWGSSDERYHIVGGNQRLPEAIAAELPGGTLRHGWQLLALRSNDDSTQTLVFEVDGRVREAQVDHTVLAVPLGVLQRLDLSRAGLDHRKRRTLAAMPMGACTKLNMQLARREYSGTGPWPGVSNGECFTDTGFQQVWDATRGQDGEAGVLIQYGGGAAARRLHPATAFGTESEPYVRTTTRSVLDAVDDVLPGVRDAWTGRSTLSAWHRNPLSHGAYAYWPPDYCHRFAGYEGVRQGNVHFAGEHTSVDHQGFMNGAAAEGARVAEEILGDLRR